MAARAVFDCQVFFQATVKRTGLAFRCLEAAETPELTLLLSPSVLAEVKDVLSRPVLRQKFKSLTDESVSEFLERIQKFSELRAEPPKAFSLPRDPDDEIYLDLAIAGSADYLVSWNERHLNYLMKQDTPEGKDFCSRYPGLKILTPVEFLKDLAAQQTWQ